METLHSFCIERTDTSVELWMNCRLPLEPSGELHRAREELRRALHSMAPPSDHVLFASYHSRDSYAFDVENVLIYNVGTGSFGHLVQRGIAIERRRVDPRASADGRSWSHFHRYDFRAAGVQDVEERARRFSFSLPRLNTQTKVHTVWWAATSLAPLNFAPLRGKLAIQVGVHSRHPIANMAAVMKPLVDGLVAAMHRDSIPSRAAVALLARALQVPDDYVVERLLNPPARALPDRSIVRPFREFVKWDPDDELVDQCAVTLHSSEAMDVRIEVDVKEL